MKRRLIAVAIALSVAAITTARGDSVGTAPRPKTARAMTPADVLDRAFVHQFDVSITATIELIVRDANGNERRRLLESASKMIDGRQHSIGRLVAPAYLRGMTILQIEAPERGHNAFVYMPAVGAVRRITTAQRGDSVFGTDVTYEDLERRRAADYRVYAISDEARHGESVVRILAEPRRPRSFHSVRFDIARRDGVVLETAYYKRDEESPFRVISAARTSMASGAGHTVPTRLVVENLNRGTTTEVIYHGLEIDPEIDDRLFSIRTLEQNARILPTPRRAP